MINLVIDNFIQDPAGGIKVGDSMVSSYCFQDATRVKSVNQGYPSSMKKKKKGKARVSESVPEDYPPDNCFYWNYKICTVNNCGRNHVCRICGDDHKAPMCTHRKQ